MLIFERDICDILQDKVRVFLNNLVILIMSREKRSSCADCSEGVWLCVCFGIYIILDLVSDLYRLPSLVTLNAVG